MPLQFFFITTQGAPVYVQTSHDLCDRGRLTQLIFLLFSTLLQEHNGILLAFCHKCKRGKNRPTLLYTSVLYVLYTIQLYFP
jgi:hypothetical protein